MKTSAVFNSENEGKTLSNAVDILVVITTIFGLIGELTLGTTQIQGGITYLTNTSLSAISISIAFCCRTLMASNALGHLATR